MLLLPKEQRMKILSCWKYSTSFMESSYPNWAGSEWRSILRDCLLTDWSRLMTKAQGGGGMGECVCSCGGFSFPMYPAHCIVCDVLFLKLHAYHYFYKPVVASAKLPRGCGSETSKNMFYFSCLLLLIKYKKWMQTSSMCDIKEVQVCYLTVVHLCAFIHQYFLF